MYPHPDPQYRIQLTKHTGILFLWTNETRTYTGSYAELLKVYERVQQHNYLAGWWSIASLLVWNLVTILNNRRAMRRLREHVLMTGAQHSAQARAGTTWPGPAASDAQRYPRRLDGPGR